VSKQCGVSIDRVDARSDVIGDTNLAAVGTLLAEPARAKVLLALADGRALAAGVLASEAGVAASTASHHLAKLVDAGLLTVSTRGRHRYFALAGPRVAELLEAVARVAPTQPVTSMRQGTRAYAVRYARRCYDHLAGRLGVALTDALCEQGVFAGENGARFTVTESGTATLSGLGVHAQAGEVVRGCLDWTEQREHIAGPVGKALLTRLLELGWIAGSPATRAVRVTDLGRANLRERLGVQLSA
jgi:DNA-binding transcriptional ArsR family regulator